MTRSPVCGDPMSGKSVPGQSLLSRCSWLVLAPIVAPACLLMIFASVLFGRDRLAFRDVGYFYTPLYEWGAALSRAQPWGVFGGAIWNPLDQTGMPLAGETTTAVFYPLRMLVYAPPWSAETAIAVYVVLHLVIASLTAYHAARCLRCDPWSASVAGLVYPLSGIVLFSATNPPFLVGAAWLPLILVPLLSKHCRSVITPAVAMTLVILGGDPPTALHAVIVGVIVQSLRVGGRLWNQGRRGWDSASVRLRPFTYAGERLKQIVVVCVLAALMASPQIVASVAWSARSDRVQRAGGPATSKIDAQAYAFSVPPWRAMEFALPNLYGVPWPTNTRWDRLVFDGGVNRPATSLWTPSLYCGILFPILIAGAVVVRLTKRHRRWRIGMMWPWCVVFLMGIVSAGGEYGPAYVLRSGFLAINGLLDAIGSTFSLPESWMRLPGQWGGPFWFLHEFFPGYDSLRYPSKWLPFATLAVAIGSAVGVRRWGLVWRRRDAGQSGFEPLQRKSLLFSACVGGVMLVSFLSVMSVLQSSTWNSTDPFWGLFDVDAAGRGFLFALMHVAIVGVVLWCGARLCVRGARTQWLVAVIAIDLMVANFGLVPRIDRDREASLLKSNQVDVIDNDASLRWMRVHNNDGLPKSWAETSSEDRMMTVEVGLRRARFGRWHLEHGEAVINNMVSIGSRELAEFWYHAKALDKELKSPRSERWRSWCRMLGVAGYLRMSDPLPNEPTTKDTGDPLPQIEFEVFDESGRHHDRWDVLRRNENVVALDSDRATAWRQMLERLASEEDNPPAFVSKDVASRVQPKRPGDDTTVRRPILMNPLGHDPTVETSEPLLMSRRVYQDGYWVVALTSTEGAGESMDAAVFPVDFLSQGFICPPGSWRVDFRYTPWWYTPTLVLAFVTWGCVLVSTLRRRHS
ncbi:hypothetical protein [Rhodopirellula sp. SWK7]|uniref:hypothetical protein n=1 Tax=Rhodopirellula sp. SWK7 TaxID=595460 RepID=UPI000347EE21|nr:hypothetical protein [Rhodopirellula sp. SWK7]